MAQLEKHQEDGEYLHDEKGEGEPDKAGLASAHPVHQFGLAADL